jgi:uncharacterized membrane protein
MLLYSAAAFDDNPRRFKGRCAMLPGLRAILNIHPLFVHFPIALWLAALLFEALAILRGSDEWHRTAALLLYLGTFAAIVTIFTGLNAEKSIPPGPAMEIVGIHETLMMITTSVAIGLSLFAFVTRKNFTANFRKILLAGLCVLAILLTLGADRGAQLVYQYGSAVDWTTAQPQK